MDSVDVAVVGGGPAGMAAAVETAGRGLSTLLIEETSRLGGKVLGHARYGDGGMGAGGPEAKSSARLFAAFDAIVHKVEVVFNAEVFNIGIDKRIDYHVRGGSEPDGRSVAARAVVICPGAMERTIPVPGWTLPGVFTIGGLSSMAKRGILPGQTVLIAGTGPLMMVLADSVLAVGGRVSGMVTPISFNDSRSRALPLIARAGYQKLIQGLGYMRRLRRAGVPIFSGSALTRVIGNGRVRGGRIHKVDRHWRPRAGTEKEIPADVIAMGFGLFPSHELSQLCGCDHHYLDKPGYWRTDVNDSLETNISGVFITGDGLSIKGYDGAVIDGRLAGLSVCRKLGASGPHDAARDMERLKKKKRRAEAYGALLAEMSKPKAGLFDIPTDNTVVCRCEDVTVGDIRHAASDGAKDVNDIKRRTRLGMGHCQGRICGQNINEIFWNILNKQTDRMNFTARLPIKPVPVGALAQIRANGNPMEERQ